MKIVTKTYSTELANKTYMSMCLSMYVYEYIFFYCDNDRLLLLFLFILLPKRGKLMFIFV